MGEDEIRKIYEVITLDVSKYPLENQLFAIRSNKCIKADNCIYVEGYIGLDAITKNMKKQFITEEDE